VRLQFFLSESRWDPERVNARRLVYIPRGSRRQRLRDQEGFSGELAGVRLPFVMALKLRHGTRAYGPDVQIPVDAARSLACAGPPIPATGGR
jgi:hypothetical protein